MDERKETSGGTLVLVILGGLGFIFFVLPRIAELILRIIVAIDLFLKGPYAILFPCGMLFFGGFFFAWKVGWRPKRRERAESPPNKKRGLFRRRKNG